MRLKDEEGQAIVLVALAMSIFLFLAVGVAVDGAHLYAQRQMAQTAADGAALAGIMSVFDGTNGSGPAQFTSTLNSSFTCASHQAATPCSYANLNGFGAGDTVTVAFPADSAAPGIAFSSDPTHLIQVTVARDVNTTLMRLFGPTVTTVKATAMAAIVSVVSPVPILVNHPTLSSSFSMSGTPNIKICGGPNRSIQVNSSASDAVHSNGNGTVDLRYAGTAGNSTCTQAAGADFGVWGGPTAAPFTFQGGTGKYLQASPVLDPLASVPAPPVPAAAPPATNLNDGVTGCPNPSNKGCKLYSPGLYTGGIDGKNSTPVFKPGIYYLQGNQGLDCSANCDMYMATTFTDGPSGTNTGWTGNVLFYNTGTGVFNLGANGTINLTGSPDGSTTAPGILDYKGILFFEDHNAAAQTHTLGGGGSMTLTGTIYLKTTTPTSTKYQSLSLQGGPGSGTQVRGEIIVDTLAMGGNGNITMNLSTTGLLVRQVALVN